LKLGYGGITYISRILGCSIPTIRKGKKEIKNLPEDDGRIRKHGGGRKPYYVTHPNIDENFLDILKEYTAGDPMDEKVIWTNLKQQEIADLLYEKYSTKVSLPVVRQLLEKHGYRKRKAQKSKTMKYVKNRDAQFRNISRYISEYKAAGNPIISMDTKKKEFLGDFYRNGQLYTRMPVYVWDHDFNTFALGVVIPHGIYDVQLNKGYINIGTSKDTSEFACDSIRKWWYNYGKHNYPNATSILILCDGGGSNSSQHYIFKEDLQKLVDEIGVEIRIAHYPPYTSKFNPIERRLFSFVTKACEGVVFESVKIVKSLMEKAKTKTGLKVFVDIIDKKYKTGRKVAKGFKENMKIVFDEYLSQWNYRAVPV